MHAWQRALGAVSVLIPRAYLAAGERDALAHERCSRVSGAGTRVRARLWQLNSSWGGAGVDRRAAFCMHAVESVPGLVSMLIPRAYLAAGERGALATGRCLIGPYYQSAELRAILSTIWAEAPDVNNCAQIGAGS